MAKGFGSEDAAQDEIEGAVGDAVRRAQDALPHGVSRTHCEECDAVIPEGRRNALPGVRLCVQCQEIQDQTQSHHSAYNRRGSKDSQLR